MTTICLITLFFNYKLLWNRTYYVNNIWTYSPNKLIKPKNNTKMYPEKYKQYYKSTKKVLRKLFKHSVNIYNGKSFYIFQQVAILKQCDLKYLEKIKFNNCKPSDKIIKLLQKKYPRCNFRINRKKNHHHNYLLHLN